MNPILPQIKNIVFLMMENRSFDNLLGWLYSNSQPQYFYPRNNKNPYDGLTVDRYYNPAYSEVHGEVKNYPVVPLPGKYQNERVPCYDPYEAMRESGWNGVMNQLFGNQDKIKSMPKKSSQAHMLGFLQDYYANYMIDWQGLDILWTYTPKQLPHINNLAYNFAVSDRWFSSVPTQTNPNRAFSICGTSLGREANEKLTAVEQFNIPTIFNKLAASGKSWGLYYEDIWQKKKCYTEYTFPHISTAKNGEIGTFEKFKTRAKNGTLPDFTYLEPKWGYGKGGLYTQGHDYHPPTYVSPGDEFLQDVYLATRNSPQWENTLLFVTFDEHGGTYDHVAPPWNAINPDGKKGTKWGFDFNLFGARVPTLLISPFIAPQTVFREPEGSKQPYDHTSFIKTLLLWAGIDPSTAGLGKRVIEAPSFADILSDNPVNKSSSALQSVPFENVDILEPEISINAQPLTQPINDLFEGIPFASIRAILTLSKTLEEIHSSIANFKQDPEKFEEGL